MAGDAGLDPAAIERLVERARASVDAGDIPSCQLALARGGRLVLTATLGRATAGGRTIAPSNDTLYATFSCTKGLMATAAWLLIEDGLLDPSQPVTELVPEFGTNGKDAVTIEQLYLHTCGFPSAPFSPLDWDDRARRLERFARWRLEWPPGSRFVYHPTSSMWVAAEVIERLSGLDYRDFIRTRIAEPLGLPRLRIGVPDTEHARIADVVYSGTAPTRDELLAAGWPAELPKAEVSEDAILGLNTPAIRRIGLPGGGAIATAADLALFYQALIGTPPNGARPLLRPETVARACAVRTGGLTDPLFGKPVNRGLGVVVAGDADRAIRGFGPTGSPRMFGHNGAGGQIAWADPESGLSFAFCTNGFDRNAVRQARRTVALSARAAACVAG
ncbi:MAG TPA: serine hydrolase domain-containing protein [Candidatus Limnocylindria bacterium]|nr:serine hydrolase domain-containing protein [Candidatus Limnocylindria bacterium]